MKLLPWLKLGLPTLLILSLGLVSIYSLSPQSLWLQLVAAGVGGLFLWIFSQIDLEFHRSFSRVYYLVSIILLLTPFVFGQITRGSTRWLNLAGLSLQPSELVKPFLIIFFSWAAAKYQPNNFKNVLILSAWFFLPFILIFQQPDLGSSIILFLIWFSIVFASGLKTKYLLVALVLVLATLPFLNQVLKPYQLNRIQTFLNPGADPLGQGYHSLQALIAIGSGGFLGQGLGQGSQVQLRFLPERQTDFIFASFSEEFGFLGNFILLGLYLWVFLQVLKTAQEQNNRFAYLLGVGCFSALFFQTLINLGISLRLLPVTGITLPFFSVGGSSLVSSLIIVGLCLRLKLGSSSSFSLEIG